MINREDFTEIGKVIKSHGIFGELLISSDVELDAEIFEYLFIEINGNLIPFKIESFRWTRNESGLLKLTDVNEQEGKELIGCTCFIESNEIIYDNLESTAFSMEGFKIFSKNLDYVGTVIDIDKQSTNWLFVVLQENKNEILIPIAEEYLVEVNEEEQRIILNLPEGLLDL